MRVNLYLLSTHFRVMINELVKLQTSYLLSNEFNVSD